MVKIERKQVVMQTEEVEKVGRPNKLSSHI